MPRSSVLAVYGLTSFSDSRTLIDRIIRIATNAHDRRSSQLYFGVYRELVTFGMLQSLIPEKGKRDAVIRFYEQIKNLSAAQNHPHFWMQYALARLSQDHPEDLEKAKFYLDSAYSHAKRISNYHTDHLDTVYAKYLIKHSAVTADIVQALKEISEAHAILLKQTRLEKTEAPYKTAKDYLLFYNSKKQYLNGEQKSYLIKISKQILENIQYLSSDLQQEPSVRYCQSDLGSLISDAERSTAI